MKTSRNGSRDSQTESFVQGHWTAMCCSLFSHVQLFATLQSRTVAHQAFLSFTISWEFAQTHTHWVSDTTQPSHSLLPHSPPALNISPYLDSNKPKQNKKNIPWKETIFCPIVGVKNSPLLQIPNIISLPTGKIISRRKKMKI